MDARFESGMEDCSRRTKRRLQIASQLISRFLMNLDTTGELDGKTSKIENVIQRTRSFVGVEMTRLLQGLLMFLLAAPFSAGGKSPLHRPATRHAIVSPVPSSVQLPQVRTSLSSDRQEGDKRKQDLDAC